MLSPVSGAWLTLLVPATMLQIGLRDGTAPWFHTNDSVYQIEIAGDLVLDGTNPYGHNYGGTGMERIYDLDGTEPDPARQIVALGHFPYFPGMALFGAGARLLPSPLDDARFAVLLCTRALLPAAMLLRGPFPVRLVVGAVLAANPLAVRGAWFGTADAPAVKMLKCNDTDCYDVGEQTLTVPASSALRPRIAGMIKSMSSKIRTDTALDAAEKQLLNIATVPIYKILAVQAYAHYALTDGEIETLEDADLAEIFLDLVVGDRNARIADSHLDRLPIP